MQNACEDFVLEVMSCHWGQTMHRWMRAHHRLKIGATSCLGIFLCILVCFGISYISFWYLREFLGCMTCFSSFPTSWYAGFSGVRSWSLIQAQQFPVSGPRARVPKERDFVRRLDEQKRKLNAESWEWGGSHPNRQLEFGLQVKVQRIGVVSQVQIF